MLISVLIATSASFAAGRDHSWPQFHGPSRDNISTETGLLENWPDKGPPLIWTADGLGHGFSSVSIAAGRIYTAGNIEKDTVVTALDLNGQVLWRAVNGRAWMKDYPGSRGTPTIDGNRIYHQSPIGNLVCLEAKTGDIVWEVDILNKVGSKNNKWALAESLLVDGDHVISCPGGPQTCMVALNKNTGSIVWKTPSTGELAGYSSPILIRHEGLRIITTLTAKAIIGVNAENGELLWHVKHESYADENVMIPIFHDGCIFISTLATGSVKWKLNVDGSKASLEEIWRTKEMDNHHGGVIFLDGNLYGTSTVVNSKKWITLDWRTGHNKFMHEGVGKGSLTCADGMLYTLSIDRVMGLVRPAPGGLELVSSFEIPKGGKGKSWAHPVVCGGRLYIRHGDFLYAYNVR
jgi:outer membrane protein assembly factor BamB